MMANNPYRSHSTPPACPSKPSGISQARDLNLTRSTISIRNSPDGFQTNSGNDDQVNFTAHRRRQRCPDGDDRSHFGQPENLNDFSCNRAHRDHEQSSDEINQSNFRNPTDCNNSRNTGKGKGDNDLFSSTGNITRSENHVDKGANFDQNDPSNREYQNSGSFTEENDRGKNCESLPNNLSNFKTQSQRGSNGNSGADHYSGTGPNINQTNPFNARNNNLHARPDNFHSRQNSSDKNQSQNPFNNHTPHNNNNHISSTFKHIFQVLYTHQKTKKKKSWKDGRLVLQNTSASLFEAISIPGSAGGAIDSLDLTTKEARCLRDGYYDGELESEKFLITVEGPWNAVGGGSDGSVNGTNNDDNDSNNPLWNNPTTQSTKRQLQQRQLLRQRQQPSASMKKLLSNKFRIPQKIIPLHPEEKRRREAINGGGGIGGRRMAKRSRPLQPGELERRFYGDGSGTYGHCGNDDHGHGGRNGGGDCGGERRYGDELRSRPNGKQVRFGTNQYAYTHDGAERVRQHSQVFRCNDQERSFDGGFQQRCGVNSDRDVNNPNRICRMEENPDSKSTGHKWDVGDPPEYAGENENTENHGPSNWNDSGKNDRFDSVNDSLGNIGTAVQHFDSQGNIGKGFHGPSEFVSDGFDPRGLYGEEDEDGEECSANEDDKGVEGVADYQHENHQAIDYCDYASTMHSQSHGKNYTTIPSKNDISSPNHAIQHQVPPTTSRNFCSTSQEDEKETQELLALFDDNVSQDVHQSDSHDDLSATESFKPRDDREHGGRDGFKNENPRHADDNNHAQSDSFIASIRQADEQEDDACDGWESKFSSIYGGFEGGDVDVIGSTCDEDGDSCADKNVTNGIIDKHVSGFSLPSPGESSSEGDETDSE
mmetsp:Transcript_3144/g.6410  ORF Transcript_3144/g.6410 Transcript_3144/m.6410 type:complete len:879 (-) Transcript_3144:476-3112(-)